MLHLLRNTLAPFASFFAVPRRTRNCRSGQAMTAVISANLQGVADLVLRQAQRQGYILPRQVRQVLAEAGVPESLWKDVLTAARPGLTYRKGRYYYTVPVSARVRQEQAQQHDI